MNKLFFNCRKFYIILFFSPWTCMSILLSPSGLFMSLITNNYIACTTCQILYNIGSFNTLSQIGCFESRLPRWRLGCRILTREYSWDKHLWKRGRRCRIGQREKPSYGSIPIKDSANPWETLELNWPFRVVLSWDKGPRPLLLPHWCGCVIDMSCPLKKDDFEWGSFLGEAVPKEGWQLWASCW